MCHSDPQRQHQSPPALAHQDGCQDDLEDNVMDFVDPQFVLESDVGSTAESTPDRGAHAAAKRPQPKPIVREDPSSSSSQSQSRSSLSSLSLGGQGMTTTDGSTSSPFTPSADALSPTHGQQSYYPSKIMTMQQRKTVSSSMAAARASSEAEQQRQLLQRTDQERLASQTSALDMRQYFSTRFCLECGTSESPEWRKGADGDKTLCNACGLRFARQQKQQAHRRASREMAEKILSEQDSEKKPTGMYAESSSSQVLSSSMSDSMVSAKMIDDLNIAQLIEESRTELWQHLSNQHAMASVPLSGMSAGAPSVPATVAPRSKRKGKRRHMDGVGEDEGEEM